MNVKTLLSFISIVKMQYDLIIILLNNRPPVIKKKKRVKTNLPAVL